MPIIQRFKICVLYSLSKYFSVTISHTLFFLVHSFNPQWNTNFTSSIGRVLFFNPLNAELNPICYLLALLAHHFLHISRIRVKSLTLRLPMSYIYMEHLFLMFLDHTQWRSTVGRTPLDEWSARPEESYRLWCVVCVLETSRIGAPYIYIWH